jgi:hypothetical protein
LAFPWIFESNFEAGTNAEWDSESDTGSLLDFPHYSKLAALPWSNAAPYRGAYCMRVQMGDTNDHTLTEGDIDIADAATAFVAFYLYLAPNVTATADDSFNIFEFQQTDGTREGSCGLRITAASGNIEIGIGDGVAPSTYSAELLQRNRWYHIELAYKVHTTDEGTFTLYVNGVSRVALTALDNAAAVGQGVLGTQDTLSTTTGTILFDQFVMDDAQIYPHRERFPTNVTLTKSAHVFVGPGTVESAALLSTTAGHTLLLFDTDTANVNDAQGFVTELAVGNLVAASGPIPFKRGCYAQLTGTSVRAQINLSPSENEPGSQGPPYYSAWGVRHYGQRRDQRAGNV